MKGKIEGQKNRVKAGFEGLMEEGIGQMDGGDKEGKKKAKEKWMGG